MVADVVRPGRSVGLTSALVTPGRLFLDSSNPLRSEPSAPAGGAFLSTVATGAGEGRSRGAFPAPLQPFDGCLLHDFLGGPSSVEGASLMALITSGDINVRNCLRSVTSVLVVRPRFQVFFSTAFLPNRPTAPR